MAIFWLFVVTPSALLCSAASKGLRAGEGHLVFFENNVAVTRGRYGLSVTQLSDTVVGEHLREVGEWEQVIMDVVDQLVKEGDTVWEAGAHIGAHTIGLASMVGESGTVHAFEPQPEARILLSTAVALNGLSQRVLVHEEALGNSTGTRLAFPKLKSTSNTGAYSFVGQRPSTSEGARTASLDELEKDLVGGCPRLIKSDVEGMDAEMLAGAKAVISKCRPHLVFETMAPRRDWSAEKFLQFRKQGYVCSWLTFRIVPSVRDAFRVPDVEPTGLDEERRRGPMSYNAVCTSGVHAVHSSSPDGVLLPARDGTRDQLYSGDDCLEYESSLIESGAFEWVTGIEPGGSSSSRSICYS